MSLNITMEGVERGGSSKKRDRPTSNSCETLLTKKKVRRSPRHAKLNTKFVKDYEIRRSRYKVQKCMTVDYQRLEEYFESSVCVPMHSEAVLPDQSLSQPLLDSLFIGTSPSLRSSRKSTSALSTMFLGRILLRAPEGCMDYIDRLIAEISQYNRLKVLRVDGRFLHFNGGYDILQKCGACGSEFCVCADLLKISEPLGQQCQDSSKTWNEIQKCSISNPWQFFQTISYDKSAACQRCFSDVLFESILRILREHSPCILYIRNLEDFFLNTDQVLAFQKILQKFRIPNCSIIGTIFEPSEPREIENPVIARLNNLLPYRLYVPKISVTAPEANSDIGETVHRSFLDFRRMMQRSQLSVSHTGGENTCREVMAEFFQLPRLAQRTLNQILTSMMKHHLVDQNSITHAQGCFENTSLESFRYAVQIQTPRHLYADSEPPTLETLDLTKYEKKISWELVHAKDIPVTFDDIGSHEQIIDQLQKIVLWPMRYPSLFQGPLTGAPKNVLLFGPPGTGKTMMAKAIARSARAHFLNINPSSIGSKYHGESEKFVAAVFSLARKLRRCIIFLDEADSLLGTRDSGEQAHDRKVKNEFMMQWEGIASTGTTTPDTAVQSRIILVAATNRPWDLDDAVIRRFSARLMVDLPDLGARQKILQVLLKQEVLAEEVDMFSLARRTEGYNGSDLRNLCSTAALKRLYQCIESLEVSDAIRPIQMQDFESALDTIRPSSGANKDSFTYRQLHEWNATYGQNNHGAGPASLPHLTYYL
jgi:ATP-dependent 26S proteasome regulatory subunit